MHTAGFQSIVVRVQVHYTEYSLLNHCCAPNCTTDTDDGVMVVTTLRDIKKGEQLSIGYISIVYQLLPREFQRNVIDGGFWV